MMEMEQQVASNPILIASILRNLTSQELLQQRLVCKLWRDEANLMIRRRQQKFFFSPYSTTKSLENRNDVEWTKSWENVLQISFIYSPLRDTFIRASRRLLDMAHPIFDLEASSRDPAEGWSESAFFQEIENFYTQRQSRTSQHSITNCKTAGFTLDQFSEYLETLHKNSDRDLEDHSIFPCLSYRFECGRLFGRREIHRFFAVLGPKIQYLTVGLNHMCRKSDETVKDPWDRDTKWDHRYEVFEEVPNLQVLTIVPFSKWFDKLSKSRHHFDNRLNEPSPRVLGQVVLDGGQRVFRASLGENAPLRHLQCLRILGQGEAYNEFYARWILLQARNVERVVYEHGFLPCLLPFLGEVNVRSPVTPAHSTVLPRPMRLVTPVTTLCLRIFEDSPKMLQYLAQVIDLQQSVGGGQKVKTLHLYLEEVPDDLGRNSPYSTPHVAPLIQILQALTDTLEKMCLVGGAAVFLEGLLKLQGQGQEDQPLKKFSSVRKLIISPADASDLNINDFRCTPLVAGIANLGLDVDPNLTSTTSLSKVFPRVEELNLDARLDDFDRDNDTKNWIAFLPRSDLFLDNQPGGQGQGQDFVVDEVTSVRTIHFGREFPEKVFEFWKFSNLQTLCLDYAPFSRMTQVIWSLSSLEHLTINKIPSHRWDEDDDEFLPPLHDSISQGLSNEVITEYFEDLSRTNEVAAAASSVARDQVLAGKREALKARVNTPSILNLDRLRHLKLFFYLGKSSTHTLKSDSRLLLRVLLPTTCHLTIWAMRPVPASEQPMPYEILERDVGPSFPPHPRLSLRTVRYDDQDPEMPL